MVGIIHFCVSSQIINFFAKTLEYRAHMTTVATMKPTGT